MVGSGHIVPPHVKIALQTVFVNFFHTTHQIYVYTLMVYLAMELNTFKNVDLMAIQSFDPQARIFNWPKFRKL